MILKLLAVLLLATPLFHLLLLHFLKNKYKNIYFLAFYGISLFASLWLLVLREDGAAALAICSILSCLLSIGIKSIYYHALNAVIIPIVEEIANAQVCSSLFITQNEAYAITSKGFIVVWYRNKRYKLYNNCNELPDEMCAIFNSLKLDN